MTPQRRKLILRLTNIALGAGALTALALAILLPLEASGSNNHGQAATMPAAKAPRSLRPIQDFAVIYQKDVRKPLFDAKPVAAEAPPPPKLSARLTGTVVEPGYTYAIFRTSAGETKLVRIGQSIEGAEVTAINEASATVKYAGQELTLPVERKEGA
jgi:hypothetical protein